MITGLVPAEIETGNLKMFPWNIWGLPVNVPLNQSIDMKYYEITRQMKSWTFRIAQVSRHDVKQHQSVLMTIKSCSLLASLPLPAVCQTSVSCFEFFEPSETEKFCSACVRKWGLLQMAIGIHRETLGIHRLGGFTVDMSEMICSRWNQRFQTWCWRCRDARKHGRPQHGSVIEFRKTWPGCSLISCMTSPRNLRISENQLRVTDAGLCALSSAS